MNQHVNTRVMVVVAAGLLVAVAGVGLTAQGTGKSVNQGVYSAAQAERGKAAFDANCTTCHDAGRFTGGDFTAQWSGQPLHALYDVMRTTMPEDNPGALQPQQYADILSYFLQLNKYPAGADELKGTPEAMKAIQMEQPKTPKDRSRR